jgi:hypothetical protein
MATNIGSEPHRDAPQEVPSVAVNGNVFICIPNMGWLVTTLMQRVFQWGQNVQPPPAIFAPIDYRNCSYARNMCVNEFLSREDTTPSENALPLLMQAQVPAISGRVPAVKRDIDGSTRPMDMVMRHSPDGYRPYIGKGVEKIDACGMACFLAERWIFEAIGFPWFEERCWGPTRGEDFFFCEKMAEAGIPLHGHFDVKCDHRKEMAISCQDEEPLIAADGPSTEADLEPNGCEGCKRDLELRKTETGWWHRAPGGGDFIMQCEHPLRS